MAGMEELLEDNLEVDVTEQPGYTEIDGEGMIYTPLDVEEQSLVEEDFPKYTPKERGTIAEINDILKRIDMESLFATDDEAELSSFEKRLMKLIDKE